MSAFLHINSAFGGTAVVGGGRAKPSLLAITGSHGSARLLLVLANKERKPRVDLSNRLRHWEA
jgi:hypothetical protein